MEASKNIAQLATLASALEPSPTDAAALLIDAAAMHWSHTELPLLELQERLKQSHTMMVDALATVNAGSKGRTN
ncbi:hypothetical protein [Sulfitobacter sp.]|jgi:hypothetical protein|uniref:hypothetical protein n=1 Tax=Sulfitobacter sp. TaxID=1903071 RepID=UPI0030021055